MESRAEAAPERDTAQRAWWLRALLVFQSPKAVFAALRDESEEAVEARQEPVLAFAYLAGIAGVLASPLAGRLLNDTGGGIVAVVAWAFFAGALYGLFTLWIGGFLLHWAARRLGGRGSYRRARHVLAFVLAPVALSLVVAWPLRLALYGEDVFRRGGSDHGGGVTALAVLDLVFVGWSLVLLFVGVRAVHGWTLARTSAAVALTLALPGLLALGQLFL